MQTMVFGRKATLAVVYTERYLMPLVCFGLAWIDLRKLWPNGLGPNETEHLLPAVIASHLLYSQRQVFTGFLLLLSRRTLAPPRSLKDVLVPLAVSFFFFSYEVIPWLPALFQKNLCPVHQQTFFTYLGLFLNLMGLTVALCSVASLGRSFGVFIEVKNIVTNGTYRWARHPMYSGYICLITGIGLVNFSLAYFILVPINIALISYRAGLEEERLSEYSPEYREYRKRTGRFFPKFRQLWMG